MEFAATAPGLDNYWRSVILFGRNVACYKFALAKSLIEVGPTAKASLSLEELAGPFARHVCEHLALSDRQATSSSSRFLDVCRDFNRGDLSEEALRAHTLRLGFNHVIDAFHVVGNGHIPVRFFADERPTDGRIRLTDDFYTLTQLDQFQNLLPEVEARWRLVETSWALQVPRGVLGIKYDDGQRLLIVEDSTLRRINVTPCRDALNGYQKGHCFYCFRGIGVRMDSAELAEIDHFFPHVLKQYRIAEPLDGLWNLVLACADCNRGPGGKFATLPAPSLVERLHTRNEFLIASHHPLRETLMLQTGPSEPARRRFLNDQYRLARALLTHTWLPRYTDEPRF